MNKAVKILIVVTLVVTVGIVVFLKQQKSPSSIVSTVEESEGLPRLVDLGAEKCIPCKMMAPILEELKKEYAGILRVDILDIDKNPLFLEEYNVQVIPTQIFYDASGTERFRHPGFMSKEDILAKWKELGVELTKTK